ncbi:hypothetical protein [Acetobacter sp.]|uniref:hypothetical protein n=1 Tax=Acetobacter sp. TaxID=440 RepID=UPI0039E7CD28
MSRPVLSRAKYSFLAGLLPFLSGCGYYSSHLAHKAQSTMIGMTEVDMQACAGIPDKSKVLDKHTTIYEYQRGRNIAAATTSTLIPVQSVQNIFSEIGGGDGKSCVADFRVVDGKVQDVYYSGDNDMLIGTDGVCATVVRGCIRRRVPSARKPKGWISAFIQPQPDALPPASTAAAPAVGTTATPTGTATAAPTDVTKPVITRQ